jgi:hypothetical protein
MASLAVPCFTSVPRYTGLVSFAGNGSASAPIPAKLSGSPKLAVAICDNTSADFGSTFVATRETDFSAYLLVLSIPDAKSLLPTRGRCSDDPRSPTGECPRRAGSARPRRESDPLIQSVSVPYQSPIHVNRRFQNC